MLFGLYVVRGYVIQDDVGVPNLAFFYPTSFQGQRQVALPMTTGTMSKRLAEVDPYTVLSNIPVTSWSVVGIHYSAVQKKG